MVNHNQTPAWERMVLYLSKHLAHTIHVWYSYLHLVDVYGFHVGQYTGHGWYGLSKSSVSAGNSPAIWHALQHGPCREHTSPQNGGFSFRTWFTCFFFGGGCFSYKPYNIKVRIPVFFCTWNVTGDFLWKCPTWISSIGTPIHWSK